MPINVYDVFYSQCSQQHVSASTAAIYGLILQEYKGNNANSFVVVTQQQLQLF